MTPSEELLELMKARRSIRAFADRGVARADLLRLADAARQAPSNHNRQPWRFIILEDRQEIKALAQTVSQRLSLRLQALPAIAAPYAAELLHHATLFGQAPVLILALHKRPASVTTPLLEGLHNPELVSGEPLSVAMSVQNLLLAAEALGLATCVMTAPLLVPEAVTDFLPLPPGHDLTCFVALGYPAESPEAPRRKALEQIVEFKHHART
jgi:nitroreductase